MSDLTEAQQKVLDMTKAGKTPTEIGKEMGISSQGVHGHLRRLRAKGLLPEEEAKPTRPRRSRDARSPEAPFRVPDAFETVRESIRAQRAQLTTHMERINRDIEGYEQAIVNLRAEKDEALAAHKKLDQLERDLEKRAGEAKPKEPVAA